ncbi:Uncharacterised protein [Bacteroides heparinolyticus]|uniref:Uncharacterized protein n=1 Tax=Prevotella heparinolytica TaxID=28113 RepID=A0A449I2E1_9BACE|nr:Uncharacterised protein [Bacteroides heparinolyticus]
MLPDSKITEIFFVIDKFSQVFDVTIKGEQIFAQKFLLNPAFKALWRGLKIFSKNSPDF